MEGTYPLPEAQLDRFLFKLRVEFPSLEDLGSIVDRTTGNAEEEVRSVADAAEIRGMQRTAREVAVASHVKEFAARLVLSTHPDHEFAPSGVRQFVRYGSSPRGLQALVLAAKVKALLDGRFNVSLDDLKGVAAPALRHRMVLNFEGEAEGIRTEQLVDDILASLSAQAPALRV
jgi:MoxR-like ATPase